MEAHSLASATQKYGEIDECGHYFTCYGCWHKFRVYDNYLQHLTKPQQKRPSEEGEVMTCVERLNASYYK